MPRTVGSERLRTFLLTLVSLFAIPLATLVFTQHVLRSQDDAMLQSVEQRMAADSRLSADRREALREFYRQHPLSSACTPIPGDDQPFTDEACAAFSMEWQFFRAKRVAVWTMAGGGLLLLAVGALAALAFVHRSVIMRASSRAGASRRR
jgi:hypothetical protein